jgi:hypothetical protein
MRIKKVGKKRKNIKPAVFGMIILLFGVMAGPKVIARYQDSGWTDFSDTQSDTVTPTMNIGQTAASLEDVLKKYQQLINSGSGSNKLLESLDGLYQTATNDYANATALENSAGKSQLFDNLTQSALSLTLSIFERKDSLNHYGDFSTTQLTQSQLDLALAAKTLAQVKLELTK